MQSAHCRIAAPARSAVDDERWPASRITAFFNVQRVPLAGIEPEFAVGLDCGIKTEAAVQRHDHRAPQRTPQRGPAPWPDAGAGCVGLGSRMFLEV